MKADNKFYLSFAIGGLLMALIFGGLKYINNESMGIISTMITFLYGGFVTQMLLRKKKSLSRDMTIGSVLVMFLWLLFTPISTSGGTFLVKKVEFIGIITIIVVLLERNFLNAILRHIKKKEQIHPGFIGNLLILTFLIISGISERIGVLFQQYWWLVLVWIVGLLLFMYHLVTKNLSKIVIVIKKRIK